MTIRTLEIGGLQLPIGASHGIEQNIEPFGGSSLLRMMAGNGVKQTHWKRLRVRISGNGVIPPGLQALDYSQPMTIKCAGVRSIVSASNIITLPAARRSDTGYEPYGLAQLPRGDMVGTICNVVGNVATLAAVTGAIGYAACYWPQLTVFADEPTERVDVRRGARSWDLIAEEQ